MTTKEYNKFKTILGNRTIVPAHVEGLCAAIERKNLLEYYPILINEKMEVIDGQHRLMAAAKLNLEVTYKVVNGLKLEDVMSVNTSSRSWSIMNFIDCYIQLDSPDYLRLKEFMDEHDLSPGIAAGLLQGFGYGGGHISNVIKSGKFAVNTPDKAEKIANQLNQLKKHSVYQLKSDRTFIKALWEVNDVKDFDFKRLIAKIEQSSAVLEKQHTLQQYLLQIEELYNFNAKIYVGIYGEVQKGAKRL